MSEWFEKDLLSSHPVSGETFLRMIKHTRDCAMELPIGLFGSLPDSLESRNQAANVPREDLEVLGT